MPSFKPKPTKKIKINKKKSATLDGKHSEFLNEFNKDEHDRIPKLKIEREELKKKIFDNTNDKTFSIEQILDQQDRINEINNEIKSTK